MFKEGITTVEKEKPDERRRRMRGAMKKLTKEIGEDIDGGDELCEDELTGDRRPDSEETSGVGDAICGYGGGAEVPDRWICRGRNLMWIRQHRTPRSS